MSPWWDLSDVVVHRILKGSKEGYFRYIEDQDVMLIFSFLLVPRKPDKENQEGSWRASWNLKPLSEFLETTFFMLPHLYDLVQFCQKGMYACKVNLHPPTSTWGFRSRIEHICASHSEVDLLLAPPFHLA